MNSVGFNFDNSYLALPQEFYSQTPPRAVRAPQLLLLNHKLASELALDFSELKPQELADLFGGNSLPSAAQPLAQAYAGHQFGYFTMLGDGRALLWGEHQLPDGSRVDLQFKGSGRTPYSRQGDGRAALAPMLREYLISEAMHELKIPTSRSLAVATTGELVQRERTLPGAVLTRVASSHIRVGTFQYAAAFLDVSALEHLLDYTLERHYPQLLGASNRALALLQAVAQRQAELIVHWLRVGFIHGVMNTDNVSIAGESIDYGPCAFLDSYDPNTVFSSIDQQGRYAFGRQPAIMQWNLTRLAESLLPLLHQDRQQAIAIAKDSLRAFAGLYQRLYWDTMRAKLGLQSAMSSDEDLISDWLQLLQRNDADYTNSFLTLSSDYSDQQGLYQSDEFMDWRTRWRERLQAESKTPEVTTELMRAHNPQVIPRNHLVEQALTAAQEDGDLQSLNDLLAALRQPYSVKADRSAYQEPAPPSATKYQTFCGT